MVTSTLVDIVGTGDEGTMITSTLVDIVGTGDVRHNDYEHTGWYCWYRRWGVQRLPAHWLTLLAQEMYGTMITSTLVDVVGTGNAGAVISH